MSLRVEKMTPTINPEMISLARETRRMSQAELAEQLSCSPAKMSKIEAGLVSVSSDFLHALAKVLDYPKEFFFQQEYRIGIGVSEFFHRKKSSLGVRVLDAIHADLEVFRLHLLKFIRAVEIDRVKRLPRLELEDFGGDPVQVARALRATWQLPSGPIKNLTIAIEEAGGIIQRRDFGTALVDGISRSVPGLPPMFFLNRSMPPDRYRFTLAHELGHVVFHEIPNPDVEDQANEFAAELLMPADDIRSSLTGLTFPKLVALKQIWKVSMAALIKRARTLDKMNERQYRYMMMQMGKLGYRLREPAELDPPQEEPTLLQEVLDYHTKSLGYSPAELGKLLCWNERELTNVYQVNQQARARLRVV